MEVRPQKRRHRVPAAARSSTDERLGLLVDTLVDDAVFALDSDGSIATWNPGARRLTGYDSEEILGRPISTLYTPEEAAAGRPARDLQAAESGGRHQQDRTWIRKDGSQFSVNVVTTALRDEHGELRGFGTLTRDLSERDSAADDTRGSGETLRLMIGSVIDYAIFMLDPHGVVVTWNEGAHRLKQYAAHEIVGRHFSVFYEPEDQASGKPERLLEEAIRAGRVEDEGWRVRKDGTRFWADVVITALRSTDGQFRGFGKVTRDLTERKQAEDALHIAIEQQRGAVEKLAEANRSQQNLIAMVAHDLRAPVGVIHGTADMLVQDWESVDDAGRLDVLRTMLSSSSRLTALVDDVLDMARIETGRLRYDVGDVGLVAAVQRAAGDVDPGRGRIVVAAPADEVMVRGDERRIWQIATNLMSNALKFSPRSELVDVVIKVDGAMARVSVTDHGIGVPDEDLDQLFQPFSRIGMRGSSTTEGGTGLGLYIARSLVTAQDGDIGMSSQIGAGSTFFFTLPVAT